LIVEYPFACRDANTWVASNRPAHDLATLLGCREGLRTALGDGSESVRFEDGHTVDARVWRIELVPTGGTTIARWPDGSAAAVRHPVGAGQVITLGLNLSLSSHGQWDDPSLTVLDDILRGCDVQRTDHGADRGVWVRRRSTNHRDIWFVFNVSQESAGVTLPSNPLAVWQNAGTRLHDLRLSLDAGAVWVGELNRAR
jgi:hypothetical protein